ncbi:M23 family metallopeptidase [Longispora sp. NPDC051575]|uniref:M23 family metallopeptidase n=1 Tax=Longispora sp. NPDC051575 TaxID=3154943 RepID=UPI00343B6E8C
MKRLIAAALAAPVIVTLGVAVAASGSGALTPASNQLNCLPSAGPNSGLSSLSPPQLGHAKTIYDVSVQLRLPPKAAVIAISTALQETGLKNMANSSVPESLAIPHEGVGADHDSVGLFQQRPLPPAGAGSWGTVLELMTPTVSASKFYNKMVTVSGWQTLPVSQVAQAVQVSAFPDAYAKHEPLATAIVNAVTGGSLTCTGGAISAGGWTKPITGPINSGYGDRGGVLHAGIDFGAPKGTPIRAASNGIVLVSTCNANAGGAPYSCDVDGSETIGGCGWYVDLLHADKTVTRYCHMVQRPAVRVGQAVAAGQIIGLSGSSGNSSGPHLHFETHLGNPGTNQNSVDPRLFLAQRGVSL